MKPIVAVVGRPNVGKSTLFNRLVGRQEAIVHDSPGVTRDRHYADAHVHGRDVVIVDTGGLDPSADDDIGRGIARHAVAAIDEADVVVCVLDGTAPPTEPDREAISLLRRSSKAVLYVANKIDGEGQWVEAELHRLGVDQLYPVSALHGRGFAEMEAALVRELPPVGEAEQEDDEVVRVAIIGKPNAGKSTLFNRLSGAERSLVDDTPGTTRDPIDSEVVFGQDRFVIVDTAGIRRRSRIRSDVESASVMRAIRTLDRANVALLLCNAVDGIGDQDQRLAGLAIDRGCALVVGLNQSDRLDKEQRAAANENAHEQLHFAQWVEVRMLSAEHGAGVADLVACLMATAREYRHRIGTSELNRFFEEVVSRRPPPTSGGRSPRLYYITQARSAPPVFVVMTDAPANVKASYRRFITNQIRKRFGFASVPIVVTFRLRRRRE